MMEALYPAESFARGREHSHRCNSTGAVIVAGLLHAMYKQPHVSGKWTPGDEVRPWSGMPRRRKKQGTRAAEEKKTKTEDGEPDEGCKALLNAAGKANEDVSTIQRIDVHGSSASMLTSVGGSLRPLENLTRLDLPQNSLTSLDGIVDASSLQHISLANNRLHSLNGLDKLQKSLRVLNVSNNLLTDVSSLHTCTNLQALVLNDNHLTDAAFSSEFHMSHKLQQLNTLVLSGNDLTTFPLVIAQKAPMLRKLSLSRNRIGTLPHADSVFPGCAKLKELRIASNQLEGLPSSMPAAPTLRLLDLSRNKIDSLVSIEAVLPQLFRLEQLSLKSCPLVSSAAFDYSKVAVLCPSLRILDGQKLHKLKGSTKFNTDGDCAPQTNARTSKDKRKRHHDDAPSIAEATTAPADANPSQRVNKRRQNTTFEDEVFSEATSTAAEGHDEEETKKEKYSSQASDGRGLLTVKKAGSQYRPKTKKEQNVLVSGQKALEQAAHAFAEQIDSW